MNSDPPPHAALYPPAQPAPSKRLRLWRLLLSVLGGLAGGAALGLVGWRLAPPPVMVDGWWWGLCLLGWLLATPVNVWLHELGHVIAGRLLGMRLLVVGVGPWRFQRLDGRWHCTRMGHLKGPSGFAMMYPRPGHPVSRAGTALFLAGGVALNALTAAGLLNLMWALWPHRLAPTHAGHALLSGAALQALAMVAFNLLPFKVNGWQSDGHWLLQFLLGQADAQRHLSMQRLSALSMAGVRPRHWPAELRPQPQAQAPRTLMEHIAEVLHAAWLLDHPPAPDTDGFWPRLAANYPQLPDGYRVFAALALAEYATRHLRDADLARAWRPLCEGGLIDLGPQRAVLDAEIAALHAPPPPNLPELLRQAAARLPHSSDPGTRLLLQERLQAVQAALHQP